MVLINIQKKDLYLIGAIFVFILGAGIVIAIGSNNYQIHGHDYNELQKCGDGQILKIVGGNWACQNDITGSICSSGQTPQYNQCICFRPYSSDEGPINVIIGMGTCGAPYSDTGWGCDGIQCTGGQYCSGDGRVEVKVITCS